MGAEVGSQFALVPEGQTRFPFSGVLSDREVVGTVPLSVTPEKDLAGRSNRDASSPVLLALEVGPDTPIGAESSVKRSILEVASRSEVKRSGVRRPGLTDDDD